MHHLMKKHLDRTLWKFLLVGAVNTVVGTGIMFVFYNVLHLSYWLSSRCRRMRKGEGSRLRRQKEGM